MHTNPLGGSIILKNPAARSLMKDTQKTAGTAAASFSWKSSNNTHTHLSPPFLRDKESISFRKSQTSLTDSHLDPDRDSHRYHCRHLDGFSPTRRWRPICLLLRCSPPLHFGHRSRYSCSPPLSVKGPGDLVASERLWLEKCYSGNGNDTRLAYSSPCSRAASSFLVPDRGCAGSWLRWQEHPWA